MLHYIPGIPWLVGPNRISICESAADIFHSAFNRFSTSYQPGYQPLHPKSQQAAAGHESACSSHWQNNEFSS
jgi:hypothetical protein